MTVPIHRIRLGVDAALFNPPAKKAYWNETIELLLVGRLEWIKGQHTAIEALAVARADDPHREYYLTLVGDGPIRTRLHSLVKRLGLDDVVTFTGAMHSAQVAEQMRASDILLVPSQPSPQGAREAFGRVAIEGMAAGLPVIGTPVGGLPSAIGKAGILTQGTDPVSVAKAIRAGLARSPDHWREVAQSRARQFSIEKMWNEYSALTHSAAALQTKAEIRSADCH
ncbi:colanic acid biosynthesis glycosyltransferase WcaL [Salinisphaera dokdonensis CL-ES53]|uniref:Colanic acid biosynthesis glycosyltransferase WcaL n=1 Tax=Salinisphaera dokdonensis CL-ES53 TaxID=1304272 RepID=A0ABV2B1J9_9GAMM